MNTWYDYRSAWSTHPWLLVLALAAVALIVVGVLGTVIGGLLGLFFVPGLLALFAHHLLVTKKLG
ncbi:MAG: hypothetical protein ABI301_06375 [Jatrophihabitantaceae bacterium]